VVTLKPAKGGHGRPTEMAQRLPADSWDLQLFAHWIKLTISRASGFGAPGLILERISTPFELNETMRLLERVLGSSKCPSYNVRLHEGNAFTITLQLFLVCRKTNTNNLGYGSDKVFQSAQVEIRQPLRRFVWQSQLWESVKYFQDCDLRFKACEQIANTKMSAGAKR
jgi:hypothetical protein